MTRGLAIVGLGVGLIVASVSPANGCGDDSRFGPQAVGNTLQVTKAGSNLALQWASAGAIGSNGAHHVYEVFDRQDIHDAPNRGDRMLAQEMEGPSPLAGTIVGAVPQSVPPPFSELIYYQVVGVCCDTVTEGWVSGY